MQKWLGIEAKNEVLEAVEAGMFRIYAVKSIDEGIEILTGVKAGERLPEGGFEENSVNALADRRLAELAEKLASFGKKGEKEG